MLVRTNSILLFWSDFPAQPIIPLDNVPSSDEQATPNSTAQSANTSIHSSEFGIVTNTTSTTLNVTTSVLQQDVQGTKTTDAVDSLSTCLHLNTAQDNIKEDGISLFNVTVDETSLLNNPIPTYYNSSTKEDTSIIYYKRREDYYPPAPRAPSITERRHNNVLGTKIHPGPTLDDSKGMPVFKPSNDRLKPKTMLRRLKTMVKSKDRPYTL